MGNICCGNKKDKKNAVLLLLGLNNAGKTVAAKGLAGEPIDDVVPTVGFHTVKLNYKNFLVKVYDLGGAASFRGIWPKYFVDAHGIIFVIDSSDFERIDEAKHVLESVLSHKKVSGKPLLFLANKQDSDNALDEIDLHEKLNLETLVNTYQCPTLVECCSATFLERNKKVDSGIKRGFNWLINFIDRNYDTLNTRVKDDILIQGQIENKIRENIIKRIREAKETEEREDENTIELYSEYTKKMNSKNNVSNGNCSKNNENQLGLVTNNQNKIKKIPIHRPSSAREFVKSQLELSCKINKNRKCNKTDPRNLIGLNRPHSTKENSKTCIIQRKRLKSAIDPIISVHLPNMIYPTENSDALNSDLELRNFSKTSHFLPLDISPRVKIKNGISWNKSEDDNEINSVYKI